MPPSGATAIHGRKVVKCGHRRFYETELQIVNWAYYGSNSPETSRSIDSVNKLHAGIWKEHPGSFSTLWEGQMSTIAPSYLETWMRSLVGARKKDIHPKVQASWPKWSEGVLSHFHTETANGKRSYGINHPRSWDEIKDFFFWFNSIPFDKQATPEQRRKGHETAEHFIQQFSELWFPRLVDHMLCCISVQYSVGSHVANFHRGLSWLGRQIILTFLPQHCRQQQMLGEPNLIASFGIKLFFKAMFDIGDLLPDPVDPPLIAFRQSLMDVDLLAVDTQVKAKRSKEDTIIKSVLFFALALMSCILFSFK